MASPVDHDTGESDDASPHDWPGERNPNQWDVHDAHQVPEVSFLRRFKAALLLSEEATGCGQYVNETTSTDVPIRGNADLSVSGLVRQYTYPMAILSTLPPLPEEHILARAQSQFYTIFKSHIFLRTITSLAPASNDVVPPYLKIGLACLGLASSIARPTGREPHPQWSIAAESSAADLFVAGDTLWGVMMEVDNREARLSESVLAGCLFATYGMLSADEEFWDQSASTMAGTATMARRIRMHYEVSSAMTEKLFLARDPTTNSLLMSYLFLTDVTRAAHCGRVACISTEELFMRMPSSLYNFHQMYNGLLSGTRPLPSDLRADEDGLLLLTGICADILYLHHSLPHVTSSLDEVADQPGLNPYAPLSPVSEALRHKFVLKAALTRWQQHFGRTVDRDVHSVFYFCELILASPDVLRLPSLAGYPLRSIRNGASAHHGQEAKIVVSDEASSFAWLILDNSNARVNGIGTNISIWLPTVLFYAALTIWYPLHHQGFSSNLKTGTLRTLNMFKDELTHLPWPCCVEMCRTLDSLMGSPMSRSATQANQSDLAGRMYDIGGS